MDFTDILERLYEAEIDKLLPNIKNDFGKIFTKNIKSVNNNLKYINPVDGNIYQLKTLILYLYRGISHKYSFRLDTELTKFKKFNNLTFKYIQNDKNIYRFLQVKCKLDKSQKITAHNLLEENEGDYSLVKYFFSYQDFKTDESLKDGLITNFTVCTNINFDFKDLKEKLIKVKKVKSYDDILDLKNDNKQSIRYKFKEDMIPLLKKKLLEFKADELDKITKHLDDEIKDFLNNFIFTVEQPSEEELIRIINQEIGKEFDFITNENVYSKFFIKMLGWLQSEERNAFLPYVKGIEFFEEIKNEFYDQLKIQKNINQLKILILFLQRGISHEYSFRLGIKSKESKHFDHLIFKYIQNDINIYHLLQVKYKLDKSKKITAYNLLEEYDGDYSLIKYFFTYQEFKMDKSFKDGSTKDFTICTNVNFDFKDLNNSRIKVRKLKNVEDIFSIENNKDKKRKRILPARYKFKINMIPLLKSKLLEYNADKLTKIIEKLDDEINEFLDHFIFAIEQINEKELNGIIKLEIGKELSFISTENANKNFSITMINCLQDKDTQTFLSHDEGNQFFEKTKKHIHFWFDVKKPIESFTERVEELNNLHNMLQNQDNVSKLNIVSIIGHSGIGKTELVRKYINVYSQSYDNKIVWINAESYESLAGSFRKLAINKLNIGTKKCFNDRSWEKDISLIVESVYKYFSKEKSLFVFDDAQKYENQHEFDSGIKNFLPNLQPYNNYPYIIITSRNQKWPENIEVMNLHVFKEEEAVRFVKNSLEINNDDQHEYINKLTEKLQFFPLTLQQAVAHIKTQNKNLENLELKYNVDDYMKKFTERRTSDYTNFDSFEDCDNDYIKTILSVWYMTLDAIKENKYGEDALMMLYVMSYLVSNDISVEIMLELIQNKARLDFAIELLKQYSVIHIQNNKLFLHRIVQQIIRSQLKEQNKEEEILLKSLKLFNKITNENVDCAISVWNHFIKYNNLIEEFSDLMNSISLVLIKNGRYENAHSFELKKFKILSALPQSDEALKNRNVHNLIITKNNIAYLMIKQGKYDLALENFQYIYNIKKDSIGIDHPDTLLVNNSIALILTELNKLTEALKLCKDVLVKQKIILEENHHDSLFTKEILGRIYINLNEPHEALPMLQQVYDHQVNFLNEDLINSLCIKYYIAVALKQKKEHRESTKQFFEIEKILNNLSPIYYPAVIFMKHNAALILDKLDKAKAFTIYEEILKIQRKFLEENHPDIQATQSTMAKICKNITSYRYALDLYKKFYDELKNTANFLDPDFFDIQYNKALMHQYLSEYNDAIALFEEVLVKQNIIVGENHPETLETMNHIATSFLNLNNFDKALESFYRILSVQQNTLGEHDLKTLTTKYNIGKTLHLKRKFNETVTIFEELVTKFSAFFIDLDVLKMLSSIAFMLFQQQKYDAALKIFEEVIKKQKQLTGGSIISHTRYYKTNEKHLEFDIENMEHYINAILFIQKGFHENGGGYYYLEKIFNTELLDAMKNNDFNKLKTVIKTYGDVNIKDDNKMPILCYAASNNQDEILNILLEKKARWKEADSERNTALHFAALKNHKNIVEILLNKIPCDPYPYEFSSFIDCENQNGSTALHFAAENGYFDIVKLLLKYGAIYNRKNKKDETALDLSTNENVSNLLKLIDELFEGVKNGNNDILNKLKTIEFDDIEVISKTREREKLNTLVECAKINEHKILANELSETIKKINIKNTIGVDLEDSVTVDEYLNAELLDSMKNKDFSKVEALIKLGGNVNITDDENKSILFHAVDNNQIDIVKFLLENRANWRAVTHEGITVLYTATLKNYKDIVELLLEKTHKESNFFYFINGRNREDGSTPLHVAYKNGSVDIGDLLVKYGARTNLQDFQHKKAFDYY